MTRGRHGSGREALAAGAVLLLALLVGCSGDNEPDRPAAGFAALRIETVTGAAGLDGDARADVESEIGDVLTEYVVAGFLGSYPRGDFVHAFDLFSEGYLDRAARDLDLLTAAPFADADSVRATQLVARLSLLAQGDQVIGATAAVRFRFEATASDGVVTPFSLQGRLMLDREDGEWSIFGYDVVRDDEPAVSGEVS